MKKSNDINGLEKELDETINMLLELRSADYGFDRDPEKFIQSIERRVQAVVMAFEPFYEKMSGGIIIDPTVVDDFNRLINKYNRMLDLCEPR